MKNSKSTIINLLILVFFIFISFNYNAYLGNILISLFVFYKLFSFRSYIYAMLGNMNFSKGDKTKALYWFKKASNVKSSSPRIATSYAYILLKEK